MNQVLEQNRNRVILDVGSGCAITFVKTPMNTIEASTYETPLNRVSDPQRYVMRRIGGKAFNDALTRATQILNSE